MHILSIHDGHTATACLFSDGKILGMVSEERFTQVKNQGGFPVNAVRWLLESNNIKAKDIDLTVFPGLLMPIQDITAYNRDRHKWYKLASKYLPSKILASDYLTGLYIQNGKKKRAKLDYHQKYFDELGLDITKTSFVEHHLAHAATAYYMDPSYKPDRKVLVLTLDGSGDGLSLSVSIGYKGKLERIAAGPSYHSIGILYSRVTAFLGMKPLEHEYKLMGLAPYASEKYAAKSYDVFKKYFSLDESGLFFKNNSGVWGHEMMNLFKKDLFMHRFDSICYGLQKITEELVFQWIHNWINKTGISDICLAGGVFMNVKLNMLINESPKVSSVFFMPSCGDESIALGAAIIEYEKISGNADIMPLSHIYLGPEYNDTQIETVLKKQDKFQYKFYPDVNLKAAEMLMENKIIGRLAGPMEFGARALGNRSILANPSLFEIVGKINRAIKMRDFWMPFAPSMLPSGAEKYLISYRKQKTAPYMVLGFETTPIARKEIIAGLHQSDFTCRPQIVEQSANPLYFDLISKFEKLSGIPAVLNTSFNIHGYPIVNSPEDALWTLQNSELDAVQIGNFIVTK
jgi:carbamoyltransferase